METVTDVLETVADVVETVTVALPGVTLVSSSVRVPYLYATAESPGGAGYFLRVAGTFLCVTPALSSEALAFLHVTPVLLSATLPFLYVTSAV